MLTALGLIAGLGGTADDRIPSDLRAAIYVHVIAVVIVPYEYSKLGTRSPDEVIARVEGCIFEVAIVLRGRRCSNTLCRVQAGKSSSNSWPPLMTPAPRKPLTNHPFTCSTRPNNSPDAPVKPG